MAELVLVDLELRAAERGYGARAPRIGACAARGPAPVPRKTSLSGEELAAFEAVSASFALETRASPPPNSLNVAIDCLARFDEQWKVFEKTGPAHAGGLGYLHWAMSRYVRVRADPSRAGADPGDAGAERAALSIVLRAQRAGGAARQPGLGDVDVARCAQRAVRG
jgi:hypothetical protein